MKKQFFKELPLTDKYQKMPLNVGNIPGLKQALGSLGLTKDGKMRAHDISVLEQLIPFHGRLRRLTPTAGKFQGSGRPRMRVELWWGGGGVRRPG